MNPTPTWQQLEETFETLKASAYQGIQGVLCVDSGQPGPVVGVTILTHGNEPAGLALLWHFLQEDQLEKVLQKGKIFFVLNNLRAATDYFNLGQQAPLADKMATRFVDMNMNRLPRDLLERKPEENYEIARAHELLPVWQQFTHAIDFHSTSIPSDPMVVLDHGDNVKHLGGFPIQKLLSNFDAVTPHGYVTMFYGNAQESIFVEAGCHEEPATLDIAIQCGRAFLHNVGVTEDPMTHAIPEYHHYKMTKSVFFPCASYSTTKIFGNFEAIEGGTVLATGEGAPIIAEEDSHTLFCFATGKPTSIEEEALFLTAPVEKVCL